ncbi:histidine phosphatase family protein [Thauera sp. JM12B12]|uniref:histidine phosphatase family protein n=1 Tax=Thauera sp. JM12B12 TaxID=3142262 RepID=UPI0031F35302
MRALLACLCLLLPFAAARAETGEAALWAALRDGGHVALIRHALAPGTGDPPGFRVDDCATQRNLSAAGRAQARAIGERFRANGIATAAIFSSQWCRCLDTAREMGLGEAVAFPGLNSFFADRGEEAWHTAAARALIAERAHGPVPLVLVTHQVNITALSGVFPASGEIIVMRLHGATLSLAGRIRTD